MKKILISIIGISLLLCGCGSVTSINSNNTQAVTAQKSNLESFDTVCNYLLSKGAISGEPTKMDSNSIGAVNGLKYNTNIEIYEFDKNSDAYKSVIANGYITIPSFNVKMNISASNDKYILYCDKATNKDDVINAFKEIK